MKRVAGVLAVASLTGWCCATNTSPSIPNDAHINHEAPHIELKADRPLLQPGNWVIVTGYMRGDPKVEGAWSCTYREWSVDAEIKAGGQPLAEGSKPNEPCGDEATSLHYSRKYRFWYPGTYEVSLSVWLKNGKLFDRKTVRVDVFGG